MLPCYVTTSCPMLLINSIREAFPRAVGKGGCTGWWILSLGEMFCVSPCWGCLSSPPCPVMWGCPAGFSLVLLLDEDLFSLLQHTPPGFGE